MFFWELFYLHTCKVTVTELSTILLESTSDSPQQTIVRGRGVARFFMDGGKERDEREVASVRL